MHLATEEELAAIEDAKWQEALRLVYALENRDGTGVSSTNILLARLILAVESK